MQGGDTYKSNLNWRPRTVRPSNAQPVGGGGRCNIAQTHHPEYR